jgi:hypothetical protein
MVKLMIREASDEVIYLRKILQKHKVDILNNEVSKEDKVKALDNFIRLTNIIYAKLEFVKKI